MSEQNDTPTTAQEAPQRGPGRPRQYATPADRQKAYRERLKAQGKRVITRVVRDTRGEAPLVSDVIDLSEVRQR